MSSESDKLKIAHVCHACNQVGMRHCSDPVNCAQTRISVEFSSRFSEAICEMAKDLDMSPEQVVKQAIRGYQLEWAKARRGFAESGLLPTDADWKTLGP